MNMKPIKYKINNASRKRLDSKRKIDIMNNKIKKEVRTFHHSFPNYKATPLVSLDNLAEDMGVNKIWIKDESYRFGLNAFKVLGGSYAVGKYISSKLGIDISELPFEKLRTNEIKEKLGIITFVTATDGNHGRGIAWAANQLGQKSVIFMPKYSSEIRLADIKKEGAEAVITDLNYDDTVRLADEYARDHDGVLMQDTAWAGYTEIPTWIMQGYSTIMDEILEQIKDLGHEKPTHIFLQAGVGSFAASMIGYLVNEFGDQWPVTVIIEPENAACFYKSALINDGKTHNITGFMPTIMAGLACGEPNMISWEILHEYSDAFVSCPDYVAARGMRILGSPLKDDLKVVSGESGAVGLGLLSFILERNDLKELANILKIDKASNILIISTEGDTDPENYRNIVWNGMHPSI